MSGPRVAVVHERFTEYGGSEAVVAELLRVWPQADLYAPVADQAGMPPGLPRSLVRTSALQRLYPGRGRYAHLLPLLPGAMGRFDLSAYDLVVTSHHAFAQRVRVGPGVPVLSYVHSPARWLWEPAMRDGEGGRAGRLLLGAYARTQRRPDRRAAGRVTSVLANSSAVAGRVRTWWGRDAAVVHPPVDVTRYAPDPSVRREPFFLLAGRLVPYKRPEVAAAAARAAGVRLLVAGQGRSADRVRAAGGDAVQLLGRVDDASLRTLFQRCRAVLLPGEEDFGIVPVEAMACGAPVLALKAGGALDTVVPGLSGVLYDADSDPVAALAAQLSAFPAGAFDPARVRRHALRFAPERFRDEIRAAAAQVLA